MPVFEYNGKKYNVKDEYIDSFMSDYPNASTIMEREGKKYRVRSADYKTFLAESSQPEVEQMSPIQVANSPLMSAQQSYYAPSGDYTQPTEAQRNYEQRGNFEPMGQGTVELGERDVPVLVGKDGQYRVPSPVKLDEQEELYRHGNPSEAEQREYADTQYRKVRDASVGKIDTLEKSISEKLNDAVKRGLENERDRWSMPFRGVTGTPQAGAWMGNENNPDVVALRAAQNLVNDSKHQMETSMRRHDGFFTNTGRSALDAASDIRTWDFGFTDMKDSGALLNVVNKEEKGEKLTDAEQLLLDASVNNALIQAYYKAQSAGELAGATTVDMVPFMAQILVNPISGVGKAAGSAAAKAVAKYINKKIISKGLLGTFVKKALPRVTAVGVGAAGDVVGGTGVALTTNVMNTAADAYQRQLKGDAEGDAWRKAILGQGIEFASENTGRFFEPFFGGVGKALGKGAGWSLGKLGAGKVVNLAKDYAKKAYSPSVKEFFDNTQWNGFFGEYGEEIAGGLMNAAMVGDQTVQQVFSKDNLFDTAVGLSVATVLFPGVASVNYALTKYNQRNDALAAEKAAKAVFGDRWETFKAAIKGAENSDELGKAIAGVYESEGKKYNSSEETKALYDYAKSYFAYNALKEVNPESVIYRDDDYKELDDNVSVGRSLVGEELQTANLEANRLAEEVMRMTGVAADELESLSVEDVDARIDEAEANGDFEVAEAWRNFRKQEAKRWGAELTLRENIEEKSVASDAEVDAISMDGMIVPATLRGGEVVNIVGGNVSVDNNGVVDEEASDKQIVIVQNGERKVVGISSIGSLGSAISAEEEKAKRRAVIEEQMRKEHRITTGQEHVFTPGETFETPNGEVQFIADRGDGTADITVNGVAGVYNVADLSDMYVAAQQMAYNTERSAENLQQTNTSASTGEGGSAKNLQQGNDNKVVGEEKPSAPVDAIPMEKRGKEERAAYHMVPIARTLEDLHDGALEQQEIDGLIDARVKEAAKDLKDLQKNKPAIGADKNAYLKAKEQWQADVQNAQKVLDYYNELRAKEDEITKSEHAPITAPEDVAEIATADEYVAGLLGGIKITPESFRKETGLSTEEQKKMVGVIASEDKGGISIERASELIAENYGEELRGLGFTGDVMDIRDMLIDILSSGHPKTYAKRGKEQRVAEALEKERDAADSWASENFGFASYDDLIAYEETLIPNMIQKYAGFDEQTYFNTLAENYEYDTTRESERVGSGSEVLQGERPVSADGTESTGERNQGGAVQYDVQGGAETTDAQETLNPSDVTAKAANEMQPAEMDQVEDNLEKVTVDNQGNPMGVDGKLVVEEVANIDEITDEDFETPTRNVQLPAIPENVANAIGTNGRPVVIKKNVFEKNGNTHVELEPEDSRNILRSALYNPNIVGSTQPIRRPDYKVAIRTGEQNAVVVLDVYHGKDFVEIVGWRMVNEKGLAKMQRQAEREGGQFLILSPNDGSAAALSALPLGLSPKGEDKNSISNSQENEQKSGENANTGANEAENREVERASQTEGETSNGSTISQESEQVSDQDNAPYTIAPAQYTTKKGKVLDMHLVKFAGTLTKEQQRAAKELAKAEKGWYDREQGGFMMRSEESAKQLADTILNNDDAVSDAQPVSMIDIQALNNGDVLFTEPQQPKEQPKDEEYHPIWQYSIHIDADGYTTISRDDVSSGYPIGDARFRYSTDSPEEMLDILRNPLNGMQEALEAVGVTLENKIKTRELDRKIKEERRREYEALRTNGYNGYKIGDEVIYKGKKAKIHDLEEYGEHRPVLDTGLAPVMYEVAEWSDIQSDTSSKTIFSSAFKDLVSEDGKYNIRITKVDGAKRIVTADLNTANVGGEGLVLSFEEMTDILNSGNWQEKIASEPKNEGQFGLVSDERMAELKDRLRKKLGGQMNIGIDPEILAIGLEIAVGHLDRGVKTFTDFAKVMISDLGDVIRPYLKAFYNGARELPEVVENGLASDMTSYDEVQSFDVANFDKQGIDAFATAETITREAEVAQEVEVAQERIKKTRSAKKETKKKSVTSQEQTGGLFDELFAETNKADAELHRQFAMTVKADMLAALDNGTKPYRSILDLRKRASELGMEVDSDGRTDILLQELVEDGLVRAAREVIGRKGRNSRASYDLICKLYEMQPTIAARSSNRIKMQQYSTPLPMAWIANHFAMANKAGGKVLEPTAGNGMLVFTVPVEQVHANELDETRLDNLREQGFAEVTQQDATEPFEGGMQYDVVIANPPFGKREAVEYDGKMIPGLDPQITLNALASMKDDGRAAIIIGGNMEYASNGAIKSMKPFFTYLYDHYNVKGVIDMSGGLYAKQGTTFPTRMILIDGRRSDEERAQTAVYPPVESKAIRKAESFDDLYEIINEVLNSKEKTNGTEILRSRERQLASVNNETSGNTDGAGHREQPRKNDDVGSRRKPTKEHSDGSEQVLPRERRTNNADGETRAETPRDNAGGSRSVSDTDIQRVGTERVSTNGVGLKQTPTEHKKRTLTDEKSAYRPHNSAFSLNSVAPAAMVEAMDNVLTQIEAQHGSIDEFIRTELGYDTVEEAHQALAAEQMDSVAMAIYQMKQGQALIIGDQTGVGKGRQMAALIRWAVQRGEKPVFITQKADLFSDIYRDLVDVGSGDLVPFIFNSDGAMVDSKGNTVHKPLSSTEMAKVFASGTLPDEYDFAVLTYSQVNTGDAVSQQEMEEAAKKSGARTKKSKNVKNGKATPKATFLRAIAEDNYLFLDESHTAAGSSNTGAYLQSILRTAKAATFASATFAKRPDTMPLYAIRTAMSQAKVEPDKMISIIEKGGVTLQEIMSRELTNAGQMVRRERDMSDVITDWKTITDPETVRRARENYDRTIAAFNAIIKFQEDYVKPMIEALDMELAVMAESAGVKRGTDKMGVENVPFASKTYNYTKQLMLALKVDAIADEVEAEINAGRHPVIALESTMESSIKDYAAGEIIDEPTFSASLLKGLDTVMQYTVKDEDGNERHERYSPQALGPAGEKAYYELQDFIRESTSDIFISPLDAIIERLHEKGYKVGELTGRNMYVERNDDGRVVVKRRTDKDKKRMQREFNSGVLDVLILNKSASTGISLHASEKFSDQRQRSMIIAQPLSDINDYMQMIGRIDRTGQVHRGYYINLGLPVPAENRFLMMLSTKLKSLNANTTTSQDSESNDVEAPDLLNKYGSQVVVEYLRDNVEIYEKMGTPLKKGGLGGGRVQASELDEYKPQEDDARKVTGYVALLTTKEQEEFYDDVVRRYNELIKYLNDTGSNDLKINVMPLRAKTIERRVSSEGIDPNGSNPFARNSFVEKVEMDVLRKPMKADEIRKVIEQINRGVAPAEYLESVIEIIRKEDEARIAAEEERYEKAKAKAVEDIAKQTDKINGQKKRSEEEKRVAIENFIAETNEKVEAKHNDNILRLNQSSDQMMHRLRMFEVGKSYLVPDNLESMIFDFATPAIFCGYKTKDSKITASTTLAVFATLDGRRRIEIKLSQIDALRSIDKMTNDNWDAARATTLDNWDSQIPSETRKTGFIMTGNILQAIADTQDEYGGYPGQLISYTDIDGNVHDGILMPDKWNASMLKTSGAPLSSRLQQIKDYTPITSHDGKVEIMGSSWAKTFYLTVPKTKKDGAVYYENKTLLRAAGGNFYPYRGKLRADIPEERITEVVKELTKLGVKVKEERADDDTLYRSEDATKNRIEALFNQAISGEFKGKPISIGTLTDAGKAYLEQISGVAFKDKVDFVLNPSDLVHIYKDHFGNNEKDKGQNIPLDIEDIRSLVDVISSPDKVIFFKEGEGSNRNMFYFFKEAEDGTYNLMEIYSDRKGNLTAKTFYKTRKDATQRVMDIEKSLLPTSETYSGAILSDAKIPQMFESASVEDDFSAREGAGSYTDDELALESDPISKVLGKPRGTRKQRNLFAQRERKRMGDAVEQVAAALNTPIVLLDSTEGLIGRRAKAKGWYEKSTGRIVVVLPNNRSVADVMQTVLHEAVAHYGLRKLFGSGFDNFIDNIYNNVDADTRRRINLLASRNGWNLKVATEEYLASLAEDANFERVNPSIWRRIKSFFLDMLAKAGIRLDIELTDDELRYILWRSYQNLKYPGKYRTIVDEARDIAKQGELKVGNYAENVRADVNVAEESDAEYDRATKVAERFNARHKGAAPVVVMKNDKPIEEQLLEIGFSQKEIDFITARYKKGANAFFNVERNIVVLLRSNLDNKQIKTILWHEAVHKVIREMGITHEQLNNFFELENEEEKVSAKEVLRNAGYEEEFFAEEYLAYYIQELYWNGQLNSSDYNVLSRLNDKATENNRKQIEFVQPIINSIVNGTFGFYKQGDETGERRGAEQRSESRNNKFDGGRGTIDRLSLYNSAINEDTGAGIEDDVLFRSDSELAIENYNKRVLESSYQAQEALQDSMLALKEAQEAIVRETGKAIRDEENAYMAENALSSVNTAEAAEYKRAFYEPLVDAVSTVGKKMGYTETYDYLMAKHGIERNREMSVKKALKDKGVVDKAKYNSWKSERDNTRAEARAQGLSWEDTQRELDKLAETFGAKINDYSGLSSMFGDGFTEKAYTAVKSFEESVDTRELNARVRAASKATLMKLYNSSILDEETFSDINSMYEYYVPLRGFEEKTAEDVYAYLSQETGRVGSVMKIARGRNSKAENPIAFIGQMAEQAIAQGNRNRMKLRFLNFALSHMTSLLTVTRNVYLEKIGDDWVVKTPKQVIKEGMTPQEMAEAVQVWEKDMNEKIKESPKAYKKVDAREQIPYKMPDKNLLSEHQVYVKRAGKLFVITVNGSPRLAQALNGLTNPDQESGLIMNAINKVNRTLSTVYTTRNINFVASNIARDLVYTNSMVWVKESPEYARKFNANCAKVSIDMYSLFSKLEKGTLNMSDPTEKLFAEFIRNGGETGYTQIKDIEAKKKELKKALAKAERKGVAGFKTAPIGKTRDGLEAVDAWLDHLNRSMENIARFAAYKTSREMGRSVSKSIWDAKEISVNFNKKGAGGKFLKANGQTLLGFLAAAVSGTGRGSFVFWNAGIQGMYNIYSGAKKNPKKALGAAATLATLGVLVSLFAGDDDEYMQLPEHIRRNNLCFKLPWMDKDSWITIPLPIEYRAIYGVFEYMTNIATGKEELDGLIIAGLFTQLLPIDMLEGGGIADGDFITPFMPSALAPLWQARENKSWTGLPIWRDSPFDPEFKPEFQRVYKGTSPYIVDFTKKLNQLGGGDDVKAGWRWLDWNPAIIEHVAEGYLGGYATMARQAMNIFSGMEYLYDSAVGNEPDENYKFDPKDIPMLSRLWKHADRERASSGMVNKFFENKKNFENTADLLRDYSKQSFNPMVSPEEREYAMERIVEIQKSDEFKEYMIFKGFKKTLDDAYKRTKENDTPENRKMYNDLMKMVNEAIEVSVE